MQVLKHCVQFWGISNENEKKKSIFTVYIIYSTCVYTYMDTSGTETVSFTVSAPICVQVYYV